MMENEKGVLFLGGTCNGSTWREGLIPKLKSLGINYYNPVVSDWTPECQKEENRIKALPHTVNLFVITSKMRGVYSIAEAVDSANNKPGHTIFCVHPHGFDEGEKRSLTAVGNLIRSHGGFVCHRIELIPLLEQGNKNWWFTK